ncbi:similar to Saccharomyces cerevisiae YBR220C Putative protein of unknown function [Maudiozyma saulgeensis]|uniref:Uncharacterized protein n=1 Tax=Maudiozyma saulgeensis TaxID=1789683 RepID=A0A1X7R0B2_9SACH|nr:similar to Saccharomyces cerevisiae YBR220C Putative protein of unknown function [Kazachstania saulgeensis]
MASARNLAKHDLPQFYLLVVLYFVQGIPVGLAFGTIPFLLKSMSKTMSFTSLGLFSMATYPYSLKILWSPIVDSCYSHRIGRRRSWIIPIQCISGIVLWVLGQAVSKGIVFPGVDASFVNNNNSSNGIVPTTENFNNEIDVFSLTILFGSLVFLCATQDIAVDGWALTILSRDSLSYASTAQTVGLNIGYFLSFTVFLAFNSADFANKYLRSQNTPTINHGLISLGGYLQFAGIIYLIVTLYVALFVTEHPGRSNYNKRVQRGGLPSTTNDLIQPQYNDEDENDKDKTKSISYIYKCFWQVLRLPAVQTLVGVHLVSKIAFQCNEAVTNLKLLEKGFRREDLAVSVLIDVPFEIIFGYYVAKWSSDSNDSNKLIKDESIEINEIQKNSQNEHLSNHGARLRDIQYKKLSTFKRFQNFLLGGNVGVLTPWLYGYLGRLIAAMLGSIIVLTFPKSGQVTKPYFLMIIIQHLLGSFMNTVQFVGISSFHTRIADPILGGTYMTLLNTVSNFGGTWPRLIVMYFVNWFTLYRCHDGTFVRGTPDQCPINDDTVLLYRDGYYMANGLCICLGIIIYIMVIRPNAQKLQRLPLSSWRCRLD